MLLNFLTNNKISIAKTGTFAGIPPTLISPVAFQGASLRPLKLKQNRVNHNDESYYSLEINGPLLPSTIRSLCDFLKQNHDYGYNANLVNHDETLPFASYHQKVAKDSASFFSAFAYENLKDCGLQHDLLKDICDRDLQAETGITDLTVKNNSYIIY